MNLDDFVVQEEQLLDTPSREDGCPKDLEEDLRIAGCDQIETAGNMLELSAGVVSTARVIFHRFFCCNSLVQVPIMNVVMACVFLAAKLEDDLCYIEDMAYVCHYIKEELKNPSRDPDEGTEEEYAELEDSILHYEHQILTDLGFCVYVRKPHDVLQEYLEELKPIHHKRISEVAQSYLSTCFKTTLAVRYHPETIVCGSILLAACSLRIFPFEKPEWWKEFDVDFEDLKAIYEEITKLNKRVIPNLKDLEDRLNDIKDEYSKTLDTTAETNSTTDASTETTFNERPNTSLCGPSADHSPDDYLDIAVPRDMFSTDSDVSSPSFSIVSSDNISADNCIESQDRICSADSAGTPSTSHNFIVPSILGRRKRSESPSEESPQAKRRRTTSSASPNVFQRTISSILGKRKYDYN